MGRVGRVVSQHREWHKSPRYPVCACSAQISRRRVLRTRDRMVLPLPFGRGVLVCEEPILVPRQDWEASLPMIGAAMTEAAERADRLCGA